MEKTVFTNDFVTEKALVQKQNADITEFSATLEYSVPEDAVKKGDRFAQEITDRFVADFEHPEDKMAHVSTFVVVDGVVYMSYYANKKEPLEEPKDQTARFAYAPVDDLDNMTYIDLQTTGDTLGGRVIDRVYDTILMQKDSDTIYVMWTASIDYNYYRLYCPFTISTKTMGEISVNKFKIGDVVNDFSVSGIRSALAENDLPEKPMYADVGIMQKLSSRVENGETYYYSGTYCSHFNCIIKSRDLITWEYVAQPDFDNRSEWENSVYVIGDKCYYFVRQQPVSPYAFLTVYDLEKKTWEKPVLVADSPSRGDFIVYEGGLYLFHAPIDREHIGIIKINTEDISKSEVLIQAKMHTSCFYPYVREFEGETLAMSYTIERKHIRLAKFDLSNYID